MAGGKMAILQLLVRFKASDQLLNSFNQDLEFHSKLPVSTGKFYPHGQVFLSNIDYPCYEKYPRTELTTRNYSTKHTRVNLHPI